MKDRKLIDQVCESCKKQFSGPLPEICCNNPMCGCNGDPAFPAVCSNECFDKLTQDVIEDPGDSKKLTVETDGKTSCPECNSAKYYHYELLFIGHKDDGTDRRCVECDAYIAIRRNGKWFVPEK